MLNERKERVFGVRNGIKMESSIVEGTEVASYKVVFIFRHCVCSLHLYFWFLTSRFYVSLKFCCTIKWLFIAHLFGAFVLPVSHC